MSTRLGAILVSTHPSPRRRVSGVRRAALALTLLAAMPTTPAARAQSPRPPTDAAPSSPAPTHDASSPSDSPSTSAHDALHALFAERFAWLMEEYPETAMQRGDYSNAHRISDLSLDAIERRHSESLAHLDRLHAIDKASLDATDLVSYEMFERDLREAVEGHRYRAFLAPIGGRFGIQQDIPQMATGVRLASLEDYRNYLTRLEQVPGQVADTIALLKKGIAEGRVPPRVTIAGVPAQFAAILDGGGLAALEAPLLNPPADFSAAQRAELQKRFREQSLPAVRQAVVNLRDFFVGDYLPHGREDIAALHWPDGEAYYNFCLWSHTTTNLTAREIHELGLREVARIKAEMMEVIARSDFLEKNPQAAGLEGEELFQAFLRYLRTDPRFYHTSEEALLRGYRDICKRVDGELPRLFRLMPRLPYGVREMPRFMAPSQTTAYYQGGNINNGEAGWFVANTYALDQRPKYEMIALALHEAVPGHHFQIALAQELETLPEFRRYSAINAYMEGWALYAERLGIEMGLYNDPYDDFGRLLYEMWRAGRLVVDPGMHALGWSRQQAVDFMLANTALSELNINTEIDRYIGWPGQATAYKIGELKFRELRQRAEAKLGDRFNLRDFHDVVLSAGATPLDVLERRVDDWLAATAADSDPTTP